MTMIANPVPLERAKQLVHQSVLSHKQEGIHITPEEEQNTILYVTGQISIEEVLARNLAAFHGRGYEET